MRILRRIPILAACAIALAGIAGCGSDKGTNSTPKLAGEWPAAATGRYQRTELYRFCPNGPFGCTWKYLKQDTVDVCKDPIDSIAVHLLSTPFVAFTEKSGYITDTAYAVSVVAGMKFCEEDCECEMIVEAASDTGKPPSRDGWEITFTVESLTCGDYFPTSFRYTYARIGDADGSGTQ